MKKRILRTLVPFVGLFFFTVALWILHYTLREYHYRDVVQSLQAFSITNLLLALAFTILNYLVLTGYDTLAFRYIQHPLPYRRIAFTSFLSYVFSHNIGFSTLGGGAVRYRFYSAWELSTLEVTKVVAFCTITFWLGFLTLSGAVFISEPLTIPSSLHLPFSSLRVFGMISILIAGGYLLWGALRQAPFRILGLEFPFPSLKLAIKQIVVGFIDWTLAGSIFYELLPASSTLSFLDSLGIFLLAQFVGLLSHVPGGIGVFESVVVLLLSPVIPAASILGSLLIYRAMYYLLPLMFGAVLLGTHEILQKKEQLARVSHFFGRWVPDIVPHMFAFITFVGGAILLFSGAAPAVSARLAWLKDFLPLPVLELSHFLGSLAGIGLLLLARGIQQRLDAAYFLTAILLSAGILFSLLKGLDYEEAAVLALMLGALLPCRRYFYRKASLITERFTPGWIASIMLVLIGSIWIVMFSYKHLEYSGVLWWRFSLFEDAPRSLRATVASVVVALSFAVARLLHAFPPEPKLPNIEDLGRARIIIDSSKATVANLALLGDKPLLFSQNGRAFIMYGVQGKSWVALGDPIGPEDEMSELAWQFRDLSDRHGGWTVFYQVDRKYLHLYLDLGLTLLKIGEEAIVPLESFSLEGGTRRSLRHVHHRLEREECKFEVIPKEKIHPILPVLREISNAWLAEKHTREKGFSLGFFDETYLRRFPVGIILKSGKIVAFANIWLGADKEELSVDLMRYLPEAPEDVMEYLFIQLMLWGKREGYRSFNLGIAPLSGLENRKIAPLWSRIGAFVFHHGEYFYKFQGLREYKEKFHPRWEPKYLASPGGLMLPRILTDIAALVGGGFKGIITK